MQVHGKDGDEIWVILADDETLRIGDIIEIDGIITQVVDVTFADVPGIMEHLLRKSLVPAHRIEQEIKPEVNSIIDMLTDKKIAVTKIRGHVDNKDGTRRFLQGLTEFKVSRAKTHPKLMNQSDLFNLLNLDFRDSALAETLSSEPTRFGIDFQKWGINLITGKKGSGKSYFAKRLLLDLLQNNVITIVFDLNGEYINMWRSSLNRDEPNRFETVIRILTPRSNPDNVHEREFRIPLNEIDAGVFASIVNIKPEQAMYNEILSFWWTHRNDQFTLDDLEAYAQEIHNEAARNALISRVRMARALRIFGPSDIVNDITEFDGSGAAIILNLSRVSSRVKQIIVDVVLKRISRYCENPNARRISLFLEEAQLYVTPPDKFVDLLTRTRHFGIFPTFITNDPTTLPDEVFSQLDNLIAFSFKNEKELTQLAKSGKVDSKTLDVLKNLQSRQCIAVGDITNEFPVFAHIKPQEEVMMGGETRSLI